jgi:uncharacterized membrane protein YccC
VAGVVRALGLALLTLVGGMIVGLSLVAVHSWWVMLALGAVAVVASMAALPVAWWSRPPFAVGFTTMVGLGMVPRPEGDYLISADAQGYSLLAATLVLLIGTFVTLPRRRQHRDRSPAATTLTP